eukprot:28724_1
METMTIDVTNISGRNREKAKWKELSNEACPCTCCSWCSCHCGALLLLVALLFWVVFGILNNYSKLNPGALYEGTYVTEPCREYTKCCSVSYASFDNADEQVVDTFLYNMSCEVYKKSFLLPHLIVYCLWIVVLLLSIIGFIMYISHLLLLLVIQSCIVLILGVYGLCFVAWNSSAWDLTFAILHMIIGSIGVFMSYKNWKLMRVAQNNE